ncbi:hypothetical protein HY501_01680, partial [Candidatus Woesearchaeota archaeon]|nr:hypothetical protein [Candidatus Woesearchaeota archaeon]
CLDGFEQLDPGILVVVKKVVGSYAKKFNENKGQFSKFEVVRNGNQVTFRVTAEHSTVEGSAEEPNLFFALSNAMSNLNHKN